MRLDVVTPMTRGGSPIVTPERSRALTGLLQGRGSMSRILVPKEARSAIDGGIAHIGGLQAGTPGRSDN